MNEQPDAERTVLRWPVPAPAAVLEHAVMFREEGERPSLFRLTASPFHIGRGPANDLVLASPEVSRQHCILTVADGTASVTDLQSTNGVHLDGLRVQGTAVLSRAAQLAIGPYALSYLRGSAHELAAAAARHVEESRAVRYVRALLPPPLRDGPVVVHWRFVPSAQLGGDIFGYRWLDAGRLALFMLDVSGHGVGSALLAVSVANMLRAPAGFDMADPVAVLLGLNAAFQMDDHDGLLFTLWYAVYEHASRRLRFASAGHHPAFLLGPGQSGAEAVPLATRGPPVGAAPQPRFREGGIVVPPGSRLWLFSDGLFEIGTEVGRTGIISDLVAQLACGPAEPELDLDRLLGTMRSLNRSLPFDDDVSCLVAEMT